MTHGLQWRRSISIDSATARHASVAPVALFSFGNNKAPAPAASTKNDDATLNAIMAKDQKEWTKEERKEVDRISGNWASQRKPEQEGYMFFQGPTPKTGTQEDMPDFFSADARADMEVPGQLKVFGGIAAAGVLAVGIFVLVS
eukprot:CAMPEP_0174736152 /NCGR_PEP_ID=MMETSP1094-20130205/66156_1 /TAXON_ID=156173 /ORGANISM="Chrysochromulina brevifilum, Strain UTEX LB 985" /LENGTH=142 /DNA_ID=CAMNT_0015939211 /DNA_START=80 /DNA_END=508 /DNA_ORIENTATION=-